MAHQDEEGTDERVPLEEYLKSKEFRYGSRKFCVWRYEDPEDAQGDVVLGHLVADAKRDEGLVNKKTLRAITRNKGVDHRRQGCRNRERYVPHGPDDLEVLAASPASRPPNPEQVAHVNQVLELVRREVASWNDEEQTIFVARAVCRLSFGAIAELIGRSGEFVRKKWLKLLARLQWIRQEA